MSPQLESNSCGDIAVHGFLGLRHYRQLAAHVLVAKCQKEVLYTGVKHCHCWNFQGEVSIHITHYTGLVFNYLLYSGKK